MEAVEGEVKLSLAAPRLFPLLPREKAWAGCVPPLLASAARTRLMLGDFDARVDLVSLLASDDVGARRAAIDALAEKFGGRRGYDPEGSAAQRLEAAGRWVE